MYCSGCGTEVEAGLNFCKRCGNRVGGAESSSVAENLSRSLGYIGGFGLVALMIGAFLLVKANVAPEALVLISIFYLATLFGICFLILRQTAGLSSGNTVRSDNRQQDAAAAYLKPVTTAQLSESADIPIGVTEHTTKTLDEVPVRRK
ncbi:MAG: hypothetical protein WKF34_00275 [Pyrinomonadaceae bacterium]